MGWGITNIIPQTEPKGKALRLPLSSIGVWCMNSEDNYLEVVLFYLEI